MDKRKLLSTVGVLVLGVAMSGCGGSKSSSSTASVRLVNATLTHASLDLWVNNAASSSAITLDSTSGYVTPASGGATLQVNDNASTTGLATITPTLVANSHYTLVAYESSGAVKSILLTEDWTTPASGATSLRVYNAAVEAGKLDVYVTPTKVAGSTDLSALSPVGSFTTTTVGAGLSLTYSPATYYVSVTSAGNPADIRMLNLPVTMTNQQIGNVVLTPTSGGQLINGSFLLQQGAYSAQRNTSTRVRLASAVSGTKSVVAATATGTAGTVTIDSGSVAPSFGIYSLVPAGSKLNVTVNGAAVTAPTTALVAGGDMTLYVSGSPTVAAAKLFSDDNRPSSDSSAVKLRLINGVSGNDLSALTMTVNSATAANGVAVNTASAYTSVAGSTNAVNLTLTSTQQSGNYYTNSSYVFNAGSVYTIMVSGDFASPMLMVR